MLIPRKRKCLQFLATFVMGILLISGCGGSGSSQAVSNSSPMPPPNSPPASSLMVGAAKVDITPPTDQGITLSGFSGRTGPIEGIHDELLASAIVAFDGSSYSVFISSDQLHIESSEFQVITETLAADGIDIPAENFIASATHTHGAPSTANRTNPNTAQYQDDRLQATIQSVRIAYDNLEDATVRIGSVAVDTFSNSRQELRTGPLGNVVCEIGQDVNGVSDKLIQFVDFRNRDGDSVASIVVAGVHSTVMGEHNRWVTGDFAGATKTYLEESKGPDHISLWMMGGGGDQSPTYYHQDTSAFQDSIRSPTAQAEFPSSEVARAMDLSVALPGISITTEVGFVDLQLKSGQSQRRAIYAHRWGDDIVFLATPFELFSDTVIRLRESSPFANTFVLSLTNGSAWYLPTEQYQEYDCYERRTGIFVDGSEQLFFDAAVTLLDQIHQ